MPKCKYCGNEIQKKVSRPKYCSLKCALSNDIEGLLCRIGDANRMIMTRKYTKKFRNRSDCRVYIQTCEEKILKKQKDIENIAECKHCGIEFIKTGIKWRSNYKWKDEYCSRACYEEDIDYIIKKCEYCGKKFKTLNPNDKYCGLICTEKVLRSQICKECGRTFHYDKLVPLCPKCYRDTFATRCLNCGAILRTNRRPVLNQENFNILLKIGYSEKKIKALFYFDDSKRYCDINCVIEKETPYYYKGINEEEYPSEFNKALKNQIKTRDKNQCQLCGTTDKSLVVHHIDYNKRHNTSDNLISLCNVCHAKTNINRHYWVNHFSNIMLRYGYYD